MANLTTTFTAESNLPEVVEEDVKAVKKRQEAVARAQEYIRAVIARGDPLKELEVQRDREIRLLEQRTLRFRSLTEEAEAAKQKIIADYDRRKQELLERSAAEERRRAEEAAAAAAREAERERRAAEEAARAQIEARERAQRRITQLIERGDPLRALRRQTREELAEIRQLAREGLITTEQMERARARIIADYSARRRRTTQSETTDLRDRIGRLEQPLNDVRGVMDGLGIATNSTAGALAMLATDSIAAFSTGGAVALAFAATAAAIYGVVNAVRSAREEQAQLVALGRRFGVTAEDVDRVRAAFAAYGVELERSVVQEVIAAGREAGFTTAQITTMGDEIREVAEITRTDFAAAARTHFSEARDLIQEAIDKLREFNREAAREGVSPQFATAFSGLRAAQEQREQIQQQIFVLERDIAAAEQRVEATRALLAQTGAGKEELATRAQIVSELRAQEQRLQGLIAQQSAYNRQLEETAAKERQIREELDRVEASQRRARFAAQMEELRRQREAAASRAAAPSAAVAPEIPGADLDPVAMLREADRRRQQELAAQRAGVEAFRREQEQVDRQFEQLLRQVRSDMREQVQPTRDDSERLAEAGASWAVSFAEGFAQALKEGDASGVLRAALRGLANLLTSLIPGVGGILGGGFLGILGGLFEKGGSPYALHVAQGRNGLAVLPGLNFDAKPAWLHESEVVMPARVVRDTFGGLPEALRVAAGGPLPNNAPRIEVHNHIRALTPRDVVDVWRGVISEGAILARETRQSARAFDAYAARAPRYA